MKKLISLLTMIVITLTLTACFSQEPEAKEKKEPTLREKGEIYLIEELEKKYNKEFELVSMDSLFVSDSTSCVVRCIDDGIEFEANLHLRNYLEVESDNYLYYTHLEEIKQDCIDYFGEYFDEFKIIVGQPTREISFSINADISYEDLKTQMKKDGVLTSIDVVISRPFSLTDEELKIIQRDLPDFHDDNGYYREKLGLYLFSYVVSVPQEVYLSIPEVSGKDFYKNEAFKDEIEHII